MNASFTDCVLADPEEWQRACALRRAVRFAPVIPISMLAGCVAIMLCLWPVTPRALLTIWFNVALLLIAFIGVTMHALHRRYTRVTVSEAGSWRRWLIVGSLAAGLFWSATSVLLFPPDSSLHQGLLALSLAVVAVLWLPLFAIERVTLITLAAPVLLPMALMLLFSPSAAPLAPMGSLLLLLLAAFFVVAKIFGRLLDSDRATQRTLYHQATHDALVGLINQAAFQRCVTALESAPSGPYAVVFIDLDRFKDVNDTLGHAAGDRLLQQVGGILREEKRKADVAARVGGDEFAILMELCSDREAMRVAAAVLRRIGELDLRHNGWRLFVSASIGVACRSAESGTILSVVEAADQACYSAKRAGRNRIELARPERSNAHAHVVPTAARSAESMGSPPRLIREDSDGAAISSLG